MLQNSRRRFINLWTVLLIPRPRNSSNFPNKNIRWQNNSRQFLAGNLRIPWVCLKKRIISAQFIKFFSLCLLISAELWSEARRHGNTKQTKVWNEGKAKAEICFSLARRSKRAFGIIFFTNSLKRQQFIIFYTRSRILFFLPLEINWWDFQIVIKLCFPFFGFFHSELFVVDLNRTWWNMKRKILRDFNCKLFFGLRILRKNQHTKPFAELISHKT